jgi:hypothetical protein
MATHLASVEDREFVRAFDDGLISPEAFDHRAHVRLAYVYLTEFDVDGATEAMRVGLLRFLERRGLDVSKYHATLTRAWVMAVYHFMRRSGGAASAEEFIAANPPLLNSKIMLSHYSADVLFSEEARGRFVEPNLEPIPVHGA